METERDTRKLLELLLSRQNLAVLATVGGSQPYVNLVAFSSTDDLKTLYFVTSRMTRKFDNLLKNPQVSLLVNNSTNQETDFQTAMAVTILGSAVEITGEEKERILSSYLQKHPSLLEFVRSPSSAIIKVDISALILVTDFQHVTEFRIGS